ncbi:60S ribosomal protein L12-3 [Spatholobus suberectus]|nr:60S ribosomal protein L12-3 [Spatholobus suberectus]
MSCSTPARKLINVIKRKRKAIKEFLKKDIAKDWKGLRVTMKLIMKNHLAKVMVVPFVVAFIIKASKDLESDCVTMKNKESTEIKYVDVIVEELCHHPNNATFFGTRHKMVEKKPKMPMTK